MAPDQKPDRPRESPELKDKQREAWVDLSKLEQKQLLRELIREFKTDKELAALNDSIEQMIIKECQRNPALTREEAEMNIWKLLLEPFNLSLIEKVSEARDISKDFEGYDPISDSFEDDFFAEFKTYVDHYRLGSEQELDKFADAGLVDNKRQFEQMADVMHTYKLGSEYRKIISQVPFLKNGNVPEHENLIKDLENFYLQLSERENWLKTRMADFKGSVDSGMINRLRGQEAFSDVLARHFQSGHREFLFFRIYKAWIQKNLALVQIELTKRQLNDAIKAFRSNQNKVEFQTTVSKIGLLIDSANFHLNFSHDLFSYGERPRVYVGNLKNYEGIEQEIASLKIHLARLAKELNGMPQAPTYADRIKQLFDSIDAFTLSSIFQSFQNVRFSEKETELLQSMGIEVKVENIENLTPEQLLAQISKAPFSKEQIAPLIAKQKEAYAAIKALEPKINQEERELRDLEIEFFKFQKPGLKSRKEKMELFKKRAEKLTHSGTHLKQMKMTEEMSKALGDYQKVTDTSGFVDIVKVEKFDFEIFPPPPQVYHPTNVAASFDPQRGMGQAEQQLEYTYYQNKKLATKSTYLDSTKDEVTKLRLPEGYSINTDSLRMSQPLNYSFIMDQYGFIYLMLENPAKQKVEFKIEIGKDENIYGAKITPEKKPELYGQLYEGDFSAHTKANLFDPVAKNLAEFEPEMLANLVSNYIDTSYEYELNSKNNAIFENDENMVKALDFYSNEKGEAIIPRPAICNLSARMAVAYLRRLGIATVIVEGDIIGSDQTGSGHTWIRYYDQKNQRWQMLDPTPSRLKGEIKFDPPNPTLEAMHRQYFAIRKKENALNRLQIEKDSHSSKGRAFRDIQEKMENQNNFVEQQSFLGPVAKSALFPFYQSWKELLRSLKDSHQKFQGRAEDDAERLQTEQDFRLFLDQTLDRVEKAVAMSKADFNNSGQLYKAYLEFYIAFMEEIINNFPDEEIPRLNDLVKKCQARYESSEVVTETERVLAETKSGVRYTLSNNRIFRVDEARSFTRKDLGLDISKYQEVGELALTPDDSHYGFLAKNSDGSWVHIVDGQENATRYYNDPKKLFVDLSGNALVLDDDKANQSQYYKNGELLMNGKSKQSNFDKANWRLFQPICNDEKCELFVNGQPLRNDNGEEFDYDFDYSSDLDFDEFGNYYLKGHVLGDKNNKFLNINGKEMGRNYSEVRLISNSPNFNKKDALSSTTQAVLLSQDRTKNFPLTSLFWINKEGKLEKFGEGRAYEDFALSNDRKYFNYMELDNGLEYLNYGTREERQRSGGYQKIEGYHCSANNYGLMAIDKEGNKVLEDNKVVTILGKGADTIVESYFINDEATAIDMIVFGRTKPAGPYFSKYLAISEGKRREIPHVYYLFGDQDNREKYISAGKIDAIKWEADGKFSYLINNEPLMIEGKLFTTEVPMQMKKRDDGKIVFYLTPWFQEREIEKDEYINIKKEMFPGLTEKAKKHLGEIYIYNPQKGTLVRKNYDEMGSYPFIYSSTSKGKARLFNADQELEVRDSAGQKIRFERIAEISADKNGGNYGCLGFSGDEIYIIRNSQILKKIPKNTFENMPAAYSLEFSDDFAHYGFLRANNGDTEKPAFAYLDGVFISENGDWDSNFSNLNPHKKRFWVGEKSDYELYKESGTEKKRRGESLSLRKISEYDEFVEKAWEVFSQKEALSESDKVFLLQNYLYPRVGAKHFNFTKEQYQAESAKDKKLYEKADADLQHQLSFQLDQVLLTNQDLLFDDPRLHPIVKVKGVMRLLKLLIEKDGQFNETIKQIANRINKYPWVTEVLLEIKKELQVGIDLKQKKKPDGKNRLESPMEAEIADFERVQTRDYEIWKKIYQTLLN